jgi:hypothetical protein
MINSRWETFLDGLVKRAMFWSPLRPYLLYKYRYAFTPGQLARLTALVDEAVTVPGDLCEIGCYRGYTTVFLNKQPRFHRAAQALRGPGHLRWLHRRRRGT